jgi:penicillin G amidase
MLRRALAASVLFLAACTSGEPELRLPRAEVEILVDDAGVPHVYAADDADAFFGAGYVQASHRLFQMDMARRRALGRWAEVLGVERVADDELARLFGWRDLGRQVADITRAQNPEEWALVEAWTAGVNRRIEEVLAGGVPPWGFADLGFLPEAWDPAEVMAIAKMTGFGNDLSLDYEIFATIGELLYPDAMAAIDLHRPAREVFLVPPEDLPAAWKTPHASTSPPLGGTPHPARAWGSHAAGSTDKLRRLRSLRGMGSNNWAIDGRFTESGRPLVCNDPPQGFDFPGVFYGIHIASRAPGGIDVAGFAFPGTPGVSLGQTEHVAWTATTAFADVMDTWEVPEIDHATVSIGGVATALSVRDEVIGIRDQEPVAIEVRWIPGYGVVLPDDIAPLPVAGSGNVLLHRWTGYTVERPAQLLGIDRASSIDTFDAAVDAQYALGFNFVAADAEGITLRVGLDVPARDLSDGAKPWLVLDGSDASTLWSGEMLARDLLPRGRAADRGWIVTANNDPFGFTANGKLDDDPWYYGAVFDPGWRAGRISDEVTRLTTAGGVGLEDVEALQLDLNANLADDLLPLLAEAWAKVPADPTLAAYDTPELATLADLLAGWDRRMTRSSAAALVFHAFAHLATGAAIGDDIPAMYPAAMDLQAVFMLKIADLLVRGEYPNGATAIPEGRDVVLLEALLQTADWLTARFGSVDPAGYALADVHFSSWESSLGTGMDVGTSASDGGEDTVNVSPSKFLAEDGSVADEWVSHWGPIFRTCFSFADDGMPEMWLDSPLGNIADPASAHFDDQTQAWLDGEHRKMPFRRDEVEAASESRIVLPPAAD